MRVLIVGAGAVGQVYGRHLALGGAEVTFCVRPAYAEAARKGFELYPLNRKNPRREPVRFEGFGVATSIADALTHDFDTALVAVSSTALRKGDWLDELCEGLPAEATLVSLQPGIQDRTYVAERCGEARLVSGLISLISYPAPLPGEEVPRPGMAYWFPPLSPSPFSGPADRVRPLIETLRRGGQPAKQVQNAPRAAAFGGAVLMPLMGALECAGWSFDELRRDDHLRVAIRAAKECMTIAALRLSTRAPFLRHLIHPFHARLLTRVAPRLVPLDLETYLGYHFHKVRDQTRFALNTYRELGSTYGVWPGAVVALLDRLEAIDRAKVGAATLP